MKTIQILLKIIIIIPNDKCLYEGGHLMMATFILIKID